MHLPAWLRPKAQLPSEAAPPRPAGEDDEPYASYEVSCPATRRDELPCADCLTGWDVF